MCGMDEEDGAFHLHILLGGTFEASSWNFQRSFTIFASKFTAVMDIVQQIVATTSKHFIIPCCVAIMVVVQNKDLVCLTVLGGCTEAEANAPNCHMASMQISGSAIHSI